MLPLMSNPAAIFRAFAEQYRTLTPRMRITREQASIIDTVINDICIGQEVTVLKPLADLEFTPVSSVKALRPVMCSEWFCFFIERLNSEMHDQRCFSVSPLRAVELLYNHDCDAQYFSQLLLSMRVASYSESLLTSTRTFEKRVGSRIKLCMETTDCYDWTLEGR